MNTIQPRYCRWDGVELTDMNWDISRRGAGDYECKTCNVFSNQLISDSYYQSLPLRGLERAAYRIAYITGRGKRAKLVPGRGHTAHEANMSAQSPKSPTKREQRHEAMILRLDALVPPWKIPGISTDSIGKITETSGKIYEGKPAKNDIDAIVQASGQLLKYRWQAQVMGFTVVAMVVVSEHPLTDDGARFLATTPFEYQQV